MTVSSSPITAEQARQVLKNADCLYDVSEVEAALDRMATAIRKDLSELDPIVVCVMTGGAVPFGLLLPKLDFPMQVDYVHATRYSDRLYGDHLQWLSGPHRAFDDRVILLIDDIVDEGITLAEIEKRYVADGARRVYKAVLVVKERNRRQDIEVDYPGLVVPNRYVFGYGMDYKSYLRNAPGIFAEAEK